MGARQLDALRAGLSERDKAVLAAIGSLHVVGTSQVRRLLFWDLTEQGSVRAAQPSLAHVLDVAEVVVRLHEAARRGVCRIIEVQTEPDCWRQYHTPWGDKRILKPDLRITLGLDGGEMHRFVEVDRATENRPVIDRKLAAYIRTWKGGGEQVRAGVFPGVMWIVPTLQRAEVIAELCRDTAAPAMFEVATNADIPDALIAGPKSAWAVA